MIFFQFLIDFWTLFLLFAYIQLTYLIIMQVIHFQRSRLKNGMKIWNDL